MFDLMGFLGVGNWVAQQIVSLINQFGWAIITMSIITTILSGGSLSVWTASADYIVAVVLNYLKRNLWLQAIAW
ncbi:bacteriocin uberolysin [Kyrpidia spormannii]|uniref:Bacteriocin uberolysin n=1 Tax=Kyrpidia spormannii TaxID=2055160 RepID=A0A2K8N553_9BACL|nr:uberolysin/carnocyclin family circular bacteriocin [Kyrpidia spormannii]ATY84479.1 bacteriocin uberolysin [Kyrpidia spormannii]